MDAAINKLRIISLKGPETGDASSALGGNISVGSVVSAVTSTVFEVQINPEQITRNFSIKYKDPNTTGSNGTEFQFDKVNAEELELKFILDGTGVVPQNDMPSADLVNTVMSALPDEMKSAYVPIKVAQLQTAVYNFNDETHRTPFLLVQYGKLTFMGLLLKMSVNYNLFSPAGIPLRAEVTLNLVAHTSSKESAALLSLLSPDLTRYHMVIAGENILRICEKVYGDEKYYLEVARANGLTNFRNLKPGTNLILPPINKSTSK